MLTCLAATLGNVAPVNIKQTAVNKSFNGVGAFGAPTVTVILAMVVALFTVL